MVRSDLHVHSRYSNNPAQWFMQRVGTQESYTEVEEVYTMAKNRGMNVVTITDHDAIEGALKLVDLHPADTFVSVEVTAYFPENGCKIHVLVYDLNERQFREIQHIRSDIYELREYLREEELAHSVAHATYSINGKLTFEILERLILLFDVFEGINGSRDSSYNRIWRQTLENLTPGDIERLYQKYRIEPFSDDPWNKGFTGGTDDHAGLFIGQTFTVAECQTLAEYLQCLKAKNTVSEGRTGDFKMIAFAFYKVACDFSKHSPAKKSNGVLGLVNDVVFEDKRPGIWSRVAMKIMKRRKNEKKRIVTQALDDLVADFISNGKLSVDEKIDKIYDRMAAMADNFLLLILESLENDFKNGDMSGIVNNCSAILPAIFLSAPFFSTLRYLSRERELSLQLKEEFLEKRTQVDTRILCFSDTGYHHKGIPKNLQDVISKSYSSVRALKLVLSSETENGRFCPFATLRLPEMYSYTPTFYPGYTVRVASLLKSLELIYAEHPDEILILTPGPIGLIGLIAAKLLGIPATGLYYTDYPEHVKSAMGGEFLSYPIETYIRWFYSFVNEIYVPTREDCTRLTDRGLTPSKIKVLSGSFEAPVFAYGEPSPLLLGSV